MGRDVGNGWKTDFHYGPTINYWWAPSVIALTATDSQTLHSGQNMVRNRTKSIYWEFFLPECLNQRLQNVSDYGSNLAHWNIIGGKKCESFLLSNHALEFSSESLIAHLWHVVMTRVCLCQVSIGFAKINDTVGWLDICSAPTYNGEKWMECVLEQ